MAFTKFVTLFLLIIHCLFNAVIADPLVDIKTNQGLIKIELMPDKAPITVENFLHYVDTGYYNESLFHRVIKDFMIQGGKPDLSIDSTKKETLPPITLESNTGLKNIRGSIAMARTSAPDSAVAQFFINSVDNDFLNYQDKNEPGYAVFGKVIEGMDVVDLISAVDTSGSSPREKVIIESIRRHKEDQSPASGIAPTPQEKGELSFNTLQTEYSVGEVLNVSLKEPGIKREKQLDLWVAVLLPTGEFIYLSKKDTFTSTPTVFKSAVKVEETSHQVLTLTIPEGLAGSYTIYAIFNKIGYNINNLDKSLRSNIASKKINIIER